MTTKKVLSIGLVLVATMLLALPAMGQAMLPQVAGSVSGSLTATNSACTATACVSLPLNALIGGAAWQITGTFVGTITFEATVDGTNWAAVAVVPVGATRTLTTTATAAGVWQFNATGLTAVRARCSAFTSGTIVVTGKRSAGVGPTS